MFPLFGTGVLKGHHHTIIPPLLTWMDGDKKTHHTIIGPYFDWKAEQARWRGLFPILWDKKDDVDRFTMVPPSLLPLRGRRPAQGHHGGAALLLPHETRKSAGGASCPLVFHKSTPELKPPRYRSLLFHHANGPGHVSPRDARALLRQQQEARPRSGSHRSTSVSAATRTWTPWRRSSFTRWDNRDTSRGLVMAPIFWHFRDPANDTLVILPFMGRWYHQGISSTWWCPLVGRYKSFERNEQTWWVFPTFQYWIHRRQLVLQHPSRCSIARSRRRSRTSRSRRFYFNFRNHEAKTHRFTLFPLYWDFKNFAKQKRGRVLFPLYWEFQNQRKTTDRKVGFPFYWDFRDGKAKERETMAVFPFYTHWVRSEYDRTLVLNSLLREEARARRRALAVPLLPVLLARRHQQRPLVERVLRARRLRPARGTQARQGVLDPVQAQLSRLAVQQRASCTCRPRTRCT